MILSECTNHFVQSYRNLFLYLPEINTNSVSSRPSPVAERRTTIVPVFISTPRNSSSILTCHFLLLGPLYAGEKHTLGVCFKT